jgi:hypothetical protein
MHQHYYSVLFSVIRTSGRDDPHLRKTIYELARNELRRRLDWQANETGYSERTQKLQELESAIEQIEAELAEDTLRASFSERNIFAPVSTIEIMPPRRPASPLLELGYEPAAERASRRAFSPVSSLLSLAAAAILAIAAYVAIERALYDAPLSPVRADLPAVRDIAQNRASTLPTPGAYGVYALSNGKLTELEPLPIKIPDRGAAMYGTLSTASKTNLPNGRTQFIAFRRDLVNNAPEKVKVRVIARVLPGSALGHNEKDMIGTIGHTWAVRGVSYELRVAPVDGNAAMIVIRPADTDFSFPAGRYALLLKGIAYDFSVDGPITDLSQCVKRDEDLNGSVYTQCGNP